MGLRAPQNPGIGGLNELTTAEELFLQNLAGLTYAQGDILFHDGANLINLGPGTNGQFLKTQGAAADPVWATIVGGGDLLADGTVPLTANWDVGAFTITGTQFISDIATGTAPFVVSSTTEVANLKAATAGNADTVTTNANLTGHITSTGNAAILGAFTVAQLSTALSDASISGNNTGDDPGLENLSEDVSPQLGGNLDVNGFEFRSESNGDIVMTPHGTGDVVVSSLTASEIVITDASKGLQSAAVATYPSLVELAYVKGVTSAIQTQLGTKLADVVDDTTPTLGGELDAGANSIGFTMQTATGDGTTTIDWGLGNHMDFTFGAFNETFTFTAPAKSGVYTMSLLQDGTGSRTATWPASVKWPAGTAPTLTTTATTGYDIISFRFDGTNYYGVSTLDFS